MKLKSLVLVVKSEWQRNYVCFKENAINSICKLGDASKRTEAYW